MNTRILFAAAVFALTLAGSARAEDPGFVDCTAPGFAAEARLDPGFQCAEGARQTLNAGGRTIGVRSLYDARSGDVLTSYAVLVMQATKKSVETYAGIRNWEFANITVIVMDPEMKDGGVPVPHKEQFEKAAADAEPMAFPTDCIIRLSAAGIEKKTVDQKFAGALDSAQNTIAHEVFHCVQGWNYREGMLNPAGLWWVEGAAAHFATLVYDGGYQTQQFYQKFADTIATVPLTSQPYSSAYFFAWLWGQKPDDVIKLMAAMPASGGEADQQAAVYALLRDRLDTFARDAVDGKVKDVAGRVLPSPIPTTTQPFTETRSVDLGVFPFELFYHELEFKDGIYNFGADAANNLYNRNADSDAWENASRFWAQGGCGKTLRYYLAGMRGEPGTQKLKFTAERLPGDCEQCVVVEEKDQCLVGQWRINNESLVGAIAEYLGESVEQMVVSGFGGMNVRADGTHSFAFKKLVVEGKPTASGPAVAFLIGLQGVIDSSWGAANGHMGMCYKGSEAVLQTRVPGGSSEMMSFNDLMIGMPSRQDYDYQCVSKTELLLTLKVNGNQPITIRFDRLD
ncbi:MAG: hypothetical protein QM698_14760 [Micropepsaceae bacterium]